MDEKMAWWKKLLILLFVSAVALAVFSITDYGLGFYTRKVTERPLDPKRKWLMWQVQRIHGWKLDYRKSAESLNHYCWLYGRSDEQTPEARHMQATHYKNAGLLGEAMRVYQHVIDNFPNHPIVVRAKDDLEKTRAQAQVPSTRMELTAEERPKNYLLYPEDQ